MKEAGKGPPPLAVGLLALAALTGCGQGPPASGTGGTTHPGLVIASFFPLKVEGRHFRPGTKVVLRAQPREAGLKPVYASVAVGHDGTFTVRLHGYGLDPCTGVTVTASVPGHLRVSVSSPQRGCPPVPVPS
jgi:hypothetical protein